MEAEESARSRAGDEKERTGRIISYVSTGHGIVHAKVDTEGDLCSEGEQRRGRRTRDCFESLTVIPAPTTRYVSLITK
eukprot:1488686-Rhodomonas_salina.1